MIALGFDLIKGLRAKFIDVASKRADLGFREGFLIVFLPDLQ